MHLLSNDALAELRRLNAALEATQQELAALRHEHTLHRQEYHQQHEITAQAILLLSEALQGSWQHQEHTDGQLLEGQQSAVSLLLGILRMLQRESGHEPVIFGLALPSELS